MKEAVKKQPFIKKWAPLFVMGLAVIIIVLDTTLLNVSLGTIVRDLNTNIESLQWVITTYSLTLAALTITGGRFGDLFGRKRMFMVGAIIFAIGSFIASISPNVGWLIIGESIIEGIGAALMMPATASLLVSSYKGKDRAFALGVWGGMAAVGSAIGPIVGGYLTSHYSWRWGFRINVIVVIVLLIGSLLIKEAEDREEAKTIDWLGVLLSTVGLTAVVFGIIESSKYGWWMAKEAFTLGGTTLSLSGLSIVPIVIALGVLFLILFFLWEQSMVRRGKTPLVAMKIFTNKQFTAGASVTAIMAIGQVGLIFGLPVFLQGVHGLDALHTGYALLPMSVGLFLTAPLGGILAKRFRPRSIVQVGLVVNIFALVFLHQILSVTSSTSDLILPLLIFGCGMGLAFSQLSNITLSAVSVNESGEASGINNTLRQIGSSLGTAVIGSVIIASVANGLASGVKSSTVIPAEQRTAIAEAAGAQSSNIEFGIPLKGESLTPETAAELKRISNESTVDANKQALLFTIGFTAIAALLSTQLPGVKLKDIEKNESLAGKPNIAH